MLCWMVSEISIKLKKSVDKPLWKWYPMEAVSDELYELLIQIEEKKQFGHNSEKKQKTSKKDKKVLDKRKDVC